MYFTAGSGMLFAAFLLVIVGYRLIHRPGAGHDPEAFGLSEAIALVFTALVAFGLAALMHAMVIADFPASLFDLVSSLAVLVVACLAVRFALNRIFPRHAEPAAGGAPPANLAGKPGHEPRPVKPAGAKVRRAA